MLGKFKKRVVLQKLETVLGDGGQKTANYTTIATVWARVEPAHLNPIVRGGKLEFPTATQITTHYSLNYLEARRIAMGPRIFTVKSAITPNEAGDHIIFKTEEGET